MALAGAAGVSIVDDDLSGASGAPSPRPSIGLRAPGAGRAGPPIASAHFRHGPRRWHDASYTPESRRRCTGRSTSPRRSSDQACIGPRPNTQAGLRRLESEPEERMAPLEADRRSGMALVSLTAGKGAVIGGLVGRPAVCSTGPTRTARTMRAAAMRDASWLRARADEWHRGPRDPGG